MVDPWAGVYSTAVATNAAGAAEFGRLREYLGERSTTMEGNTWWPRICISNPYFEVEALSLCIYTQVAWAAQRKYVEQAVKKLRVSFSSSPWNAMSPIIGAVYHTSKYYTATMVGTRCWCFVKTTIIIRRTVVVHDSSALRCLWGANRARWLVHVGRGGSCSEVTVCTYNEGRSIAAKETCRLHRRCCRYSTVRIYCM